MAMTEKNVLELVRMIAPIGEDNKNKFVDNIFIGICGENIESEICKLYIKLSKRYSKEIQKYIKDEPFGRREIRCNYIPKDRNKAYKDAKKNANEFVKTGIYECQELFNLLDKVTEAYVKYMKQAKRQYNTPAPFFIRGIIGLTAWLMIDTVRTVTILACGEPKLSFDSQSFIINYMKDRSNSEYNYKIFSSGKKMLTYKWRIKPTSMYNDSTYYAPEVPFDYAGHKDGFLGYAVKEILSTLDYDTYADVFGGSGRALLQYPFNKNITYHINDLNKYNVALWYCLQDKYLYKEMLAKLSEKQKDFIELQFKIEDYINYTDKDELKGKGSRKNLNDLGDQMLQAFNAQLHFAYDDLYSNYINGVVTNPVDMAVDFVLLHQFIIHGRPVEELSSGINLLRNLKDVMCSWVFDRDFKGMRNVYQHENVEIHNVTDLTLINSLPNNDKVVLQLDPPYISTAQYAKNEYSLQDMKAMMDSIKKQNSERRFIFHCQTKYNKTASNTIAKRQVFKDFIAYWGTFNEDIFVTFKVELNKNGLSASDSDIACMNTYITSLFDGQDNEDGSKTKSVDNPEIIITNFPVNISSKYYIQGVFNPYSVSLANKKVDNTSYRVVTVQMTDYLPAILNRL